ncbi:hypothetical protein PoB_007124000 [Plakobranchus ocellatus]|uniref:Uncharacterized protein n=1 Tax=Plakobranchus ocellatus TaxID=259542 RepID=A0AAV4DL76_9GAST|nr:hypothetical protein PoB_007124000 [Plakobranchus ocellatus]
MCSTGRWETTRPPPSKLSCAYCMARRRNLRNMFTAALMAPLSCCRTHGAPILLPHTWRPCPAAALMAPLSCCRTHGAPVLLPHSWCPCPAAALMAPLSCCRTHGAPVLLPHSWRPCLLPQDFVQGPCIPPRGTSSGHYSAFERHVRNRFDFFPSQLIHSSERPTIRALSDRSSMCLPLQEIFALRHFYLNIADNRLLLEASSNVSNLS